MTSKQMSDAKHAGRPRQPETDRLKQALQEVLEVDRPWKADIDRLQRTVQEMLAAISKLAGVDLTGETPDSEAAYAFHPGLGFKSLKDRIRNDLEAFSVKTVSQMSQQAELQARAALEVIQTEMESRIEKVVDRYRDKLHEQIEPRQFEINVAKQSQERVAELVRAQTDEFARRVRLTCKGTGTPSPLEIEKLLEPYVEETEGRLRESIRHLLNEKIAEQRQLVEEKISDLGQSVEKVRTQNIETIAGEVLDNRKPLPKDERLEARVTSEQKRLIEHAAEIRGTSITDLIVAAALDAAAKVIKDHDILVLNDGASREFAHALLNPPEPRAKAKEAWRRYRKDVTAK
jgi:uncharacterized protein (DUF1778 family)